MGGKDKCKLLKDIREKIQNVLDYAIAESSLVRKA